LDNTLFRIAHEDVKFIARSTFPEFQQLEYQRPDVVYITSHIQNSNEAKLQELLLQPDILSKVTHN
jgi:hypothetical protein